MNDDVEDMLQDVDDELVLVDSDDGGVDGEGTIDADDNPPVVPDEGKTGAGKPDPDNPLLEGDKKPKDDGDGAEPVEFNVGENFEGYETLDDVKAAVERSKLYTTEIEEELTTLRQGSTTIDGLKNEVKELKSRQPFKNENFYRLDKLTEKDPEKAAIYQRFLFGENSDEAIVKLGMMLDHPDRFKKNPGFLDRQIQSKYADYFGDEFTSDDVQYQDAETKLGIDADIVKQRLNDEIGKIEIPKIKTEEDVKAESETFFKGWAEPFAEIKKELTKVSIPVMDEKDPTKTVGYMDYPIPEADLKAVQNAAGNHIASTRLEPTKENMAEAVKVALGIYLINNFAKINTTFANEVAKENGAKWLKRVNNSRKPGADSNIDKDKPTGNEEGSGDSIYDEIMES